MAQEKFSDRLLRWFDQHGRHDLPWQINPTPYRVWVSEIMLQQTQVATVIPYYQRFMKRFNEIESLAKSSLDDVLQHWAGLGYYARGRNLHKAAQIIIREYHGIFPDDIEAVNALPGIGRSTAGAILALSKNQRHAILDGNVKRVLCRYHGIKGFPGIRKIESKLWEVAEQHTPENRAADYTQAIMDMGATLCTRSKPDCASCPQRSDCYANKHAQTAMLPHPRPKRNRPEKHRYMLAMINSDNKVALFKRPPSGIWGGLYSLPEFDSKQACSERLATYKIDEPAPLRTGEDIQHAFSHFNLLITPLILFVPDKTLSRILSFTSNKFDGNNLGVIMGDNTVYRLFSDTTQPHVGVPAPIQRLLDNLSRSQSAASGIKESSK